MQDPTAPFRIVATHPLARDPALDMTWQEIEAYRESRDPAALKFKTGPDGEPMRPTFYTVQRLGKALLASAVDGNPAGGEAGKHMRAFLLGCHRIELSPELARAEGKAELAPAPATMAPFSEGVKMADDAWFEDAADVVSLHAVYEVADVIRQHAALPRRAVGPFVWSPGPALRR